jgi:hypothetical protein
MTAWKGTIGATAFDLTRSPEIQVKLTVKYLQNLGPWKCTSTFIRSRPNDQSNSTTAIEVARDMIFDTQGYFYLTYLRCKTGRPTKKGAFDIIAFVMFQVPVYVAILAPAGRLSYKRTATCRNGTVCYISLTERNCGTIVPGQIRKAQHQLARGERRRAFR